MADATDEKFLSECRSVARSFLYFSLEEDFSTDARSPDGPRNKAFDSGDKMVSEENQAAVEAGRRLRELGDRIDEQVKAELQAALKNLWRERSVWEVGLSQFSDSCGQVLERCQGALRSGWERVWVVYSFLGRVVGELRQQTEGEGATGASPSLRERNMQDFAGQFMREYGLQEWVEQQGGMVSGCIQ